MFDFIDFNNFLWRNGREGIVLLKYHLDDLKGKLVKYKEGLRPEQKLKENDKLLKINSMELKKRGTRDMERILDIEMS